MMVTNPAPQPDNKWEPWKAKQGPQEEREQAECPACGSPLSVTKKTVDRAAERKAPFRIQCPSCKGWLRHNPDSDAE